ncbi:MAG: lipoprotein signal peptidase [Bacteroidales bacterium]|jgi:signal peptidase II|nr:lipoprotein signal peptidase [Bacteroidales bacterium]
MSKGTKAILLVLLTLVADQILKIWVKTTFVLGEQIPLIGNRITLHFIENNGMAFGMEMGGATGKIILTLFRIAAACAIAWYLSTLVRKNVPTGFILSIAAILAGALGNIIDSMFYGMIFSESFYQPATMFPEGGGYSSFMQGRVVDMFYMPVINTSWPEWSPFRPGESFIFFRPVFNIADAAITTGVISIIVFQKRFFAHEKEEEQQE